MRNYQIKKILKILLPIALLIILVFLLLLIFRKEEVVTINNLSEVPSPGLSKQNAIVQNKDKLVFSNGRQIVEFDTKTGTSKKISKSFELPIVSELKISPDDQRIAFKTDLSISGIGGDIEDTPLWWVLDKTTGDVSLATAGANTFDWIDGSRYIVSDHNLKIALESVSGGVDEDIFEAEDTIVKIKAYQNSIYVLTFDGKLTSVGLSDKQPKLIKENVLNAIFSEKEGCIFTIEGARESENTTNNLIGCGQKNNVLIENIFSPVFNNDGSSFVYGSYDKKSDTPQFFEMDLESFSKKRLVFENLSTDEEIVLLSFDSLDKILARNGQKLYFSGASSYTKPLGPVSFFLDGISIDIDSSKQEMSLSKKQGSFSAQERTNVESLLTQKKLNPDILYTNFLIIGDETNRWD